MSKYIPDEERDDIFKKLKMERANQFCAECGTPHPQWASATLGIFICYQCSGLHRSFGVHLSFVRSLNMDSWTPKQIYIMEHGGNQRFLEYSKSKGIPQGNPSSMKYSARAFDDYRKMLSAEADAYLGVSSGAAQQRNAAKKAPQQQPAQKASRPVQPIPEKKQDPLDGWDGWGDMEASLAAIERKQRATPTTTPRQHDVPQRALSQPRSVTPPASSGRSVSPQPSSSQQQRKPPTSMTPTPKSSTNSMDSLDGWSGWGDTESSLAEIERKQQQKQQQNQRNVAMYGSKPTKKYESLSSEEYFASQPGGSSSSSYQQQSQQKTFQAYGQSSGQQSSYQQGATPAIADALSSGWSKLSSLAKAVAQSTTKAVHDSGIYDAVQGFMNGGAQGTQQKSSLLTDQGGSVTPRQQYSSSYQSHDTESRPKPAPVSSAPAPKPQPTFVGPTSASQGLKPATGADDEFNELVHGGMSNSRGAKASQPGADGPLCDDLPDVDAWLDSTLAMEAAKQANSANRPTTDAPSQATTTTESTVTEPAKTETTAETKDADSSELGDDWDTW